MIFGIILERHRFWDKMKNIFPSELLPNDMNWDHPCNKLHVGDNSAVITVARGASTTVCALHKLVSECSAKYILRIGTAGGLCENLSLGDCVLSSASIRDEGTSRFYLDTRIPAVSPYFEVLSLYNALNKQKVRTHVGLSLTTDGRWKETVEMLRNYNRLGALTVDMETSALFSAGMDIGIPALSLSMVTDFPVFDTSEYIGIIPPQRWDMQILPRFGEIFACCINWMTHYVATPKEN